MIPCVCLIFCGFVAVEVTLLILGAALLKKIALVVGGVVVLYFAFNLLKSMCSVSKLPVRDAADFIFNKTMEIGTPAGSDELPDHLKGVFWFETNAAPELLTTFQGSPLFKNQTCCCYNCCYNCGRPYVNVNSGGAFNWSYSSDCIGWIYWGALRCSQMHCAELHINFHDEEMKTATMPLYMCGACPDGRCPACDGIWIPMGMRWDLNLKEDDDEVIAKNGRGNTWDRPIYLYCCGTGCCDFRMNCCLSPVPWKLGSYELVRIIDGDGQKLPAFERMVASVDPESGVKVKGVYKKTATQLVNADSWKGNVFGSSYCCCCPSGAEQARENLV